MTPSSVRLALRSLNLHSKLMLLLVLLIGAIFGTSAFLLIGHERARRLTDVEDRATRIADLFGSSLAQPLWNVDRDAIDRQLKALSPNPDVLEFTVTATGYGVVSSYRRPGGSEDPANSIVRVMPIEHRASAGAPKEKLGEVRVVLTKSGAERAVRSAKRAVLGSMALMLAVLYGVIFWVLRRAVHDPIHRLEETVDRIAGGDLDVRCPIDSGDEIGRLAMRVNAMAERLRQSTVRLSESERKYRGIVENSLEGIFLLHGSGRLDEANPAMASLLGYESVDELLRQNELRPDAVPFTSGERAAMFEMSSARGEIAGLELELARCDGTSIWVQLNARGLAFDGERGAPRYIEGLLTDISARKHALEVLREHRDRLEAEVNERKRTEAELLASREQLRQLSAHMEVIREEERKHIALAIHDELGQLLTALKMDVSLLKRRLAPESPEREKAEAMSELIERTMRIVRDVASHLRPSALNFGLVSALEWLAADFTRHSPVPCVFHAAGGEPTLQDTRATAVFRIAQEALTNVARHSGATRVEMTLDSRGPEIALTVADDGRGFDVETARSGQSYGLLGMAERARLADARLEVDSAAGTGSVIRVRFRGDTDLPAS